MLKNGVILVDKPSGPTSHDVVELFRHHLGIRQVGHMGTLDPLATGLLLIGFGEGTKLMPFLSGLDKSYECTARLGARSSTYDAMGDIEEVANPGELSRDQIDRALEAFRGSIEQLPPTFSALKVNGKPMYKYARKGQAVERKPRRVKVHELQIARFEMPELALRMRVSSGTYVRSIVHDLGESLGVGAYVTQLRRTSIAEFDVADAVVPSSDPGALDDLGKACRSLADALAHFRRLVVPDTAIDYIRNGGIVAASSLEYERPALVPDHLYALVDSRERLLTVSRCLISRGETRVQGGVAPRGEPVLKPVRGFNDD